MRVRRCKVLFLEPREQVDFELQGLLSGGDGLRRTQQWLALAPHIGSEVEVNAAERELLGRLSPETWVDSGELARDGVALKRLLGKGLVLAKGKRHAEWRLRDEALREVSWFPLAATLHAFTRWDQVDAVQSMVDNGMDTAQGLRELLGAPPPATITHHSATALSLPRTSRTCFDALLARRTTCRNFDTDKPLPHALFAQLLERVFAAQSQVQVSDDTVFLKKTSPSGGGLHPVEAYVIVQNVQGIATGLYHYQPIEHALVPLPPPAQPLRDFILKAVAQQHWFADAHVLVVLASRFDRTFWKYRNHAKAYRVIALEAGHLSQTLYLSATEAGLGAFVTGAVNEVALEQAFGFDPMRTGVVAVCGFGWRSEEMATMELDPAGEVWLAKIPTSGTSM